MPDREPPAVPKQLRLKLDQASPSVQKTATVVTFVDAGTREVRRDAIERVKNSGIFRVPNPKKSD